jgi:adenylate cyclase
MTSFKDTPELLLNFRGKSMSHKHVSFGQVLQDILLLNNGEEEVLPEAFFSNKHVFVGFSAPGLKDLRKTPVDDIFAGVEIHATALDNYLNNDFIHKASPFWTMCLLIVITVIFIFTTFTKKIYIRILLAASMVLFPIACGVFSYMVEIWLQMAVPIVMAVVSVICSFLIAIIFESRQKRFIRNAFSKYLSRDVVNKMLDNPDLLKLGGERKELTIMFSDLAGFSSISEKMDPEQLTSLLNDYLSEMSDIIMEEGGTLDKYEGDAIMAFWGAPLEMKDHATRACTAAIKYQKTLKEKSSEWKAKYGVDLKARIGIHTGTVIVGNMGSKTRFDYTVLGDAANLASRLEGANKQFESSVMVSDVTKEKCDQGIYFRTIAPITVVGRNEELWVYEPIGFEQEDLRPWQKWEDAMDMFKNKGFYKTAKYMEENFEETKEVKLYLDKMSNRAWDGVFRLDQK